MVAEVEILFSWLVREAKKKKKKKAVDSELQKDNLSSDLTSTLSTLGADKEQFYLVIVHLHLKGNADTKELLRCWGSVNLFLKYHPPLFFFCLLLANTSKYPSPPEVIFWETQLKEKYQDGKLNQK